MVVQSKELPENIIYERLEVMDYQKRKQAMNAYRDKLELPEDIEIVEVKDQDGYSSKHVFINTCLSSF